MWVGTRFIASAEAHAGGLYKQVILDAGDEDTIVTRCYSGKTMRVFKNEYIADWERRPQDIQSFPAQAMVSHQAGVMGGIGGQIEGLKRESSAFAMGQGAGRRARGEACRRDRARHDGQGEVGVGADKQARSGGVGIIFDQYRQQDRAARPSLLCHPRESGDDKFGANFSAPLRGVFTRNTRTQVSTFNSRQHFDRQTREHDQPEQTHRQSRYVIDDLHDTRIDARMKQADDRRQREPPQG